MDLYRREKTMESRNNTVFQKRFRKQNAIPKTGQKENGAANAAPFLASSSTTNSKPTTDSPSSAPNATFIKSIYDFKTTASRRRNVNRRSAPKPTSFLPVA